MVSCLEFGPQPLDKLAVLLGILTFHHHHQVVLQRKLRFQLEEVLVVMLVLTHQPRTVHPELEPEHGDEDAGHGEHRMHQQHRPPVPERQIRQRPKGLVCQGLGRGFTHGSRKLRVGIDLLDIIVILQRLDQPRQRLNRALVLKRHCQLR